MTRKILLCAGLVFLILFFVPFLTYATYAELMGHKPPEQVDVAVFMASIALDKIGHTIAFVGLFYLARRTFRERWLLYAAAWWVMFVLAEAALALRSGCAWWEAIAGMIAETIYLPLSALVARKLLTTPS